MNRSLPTTIRSVTSSPPRLRNPRNRSWYRGHAVRPDRGQPGRGGKEGGHGIWRFTPWDNPDQPDPRGRPKRADPVAVAG
jgi:hypothetical protein